MIQLCNMKDLNLEVDPELRSSLSLFSLFFPRLNMSLPPHSKLNGDKEQAAKNVEELTKWCQILIDCIVNEQNRQEMPREIRSVVVIVGSVGGALFLTRFVHTRALAFYILDLGEKHRLSEKPGCSVVVLIGGFIMLRLVMFWCDGKNDLTHSLTLFPDSSARPSRYPIRTASYQKTKFPMLVSEGT